MALVHRQGGCASKDTGSVRCSTDYDARFETTNFDYVVLYEKVAIKN